MYCCFSLERYNRIDYKSVLKNSTSYDCQQLNITDGTIGAGPNCYDNEDNLNGCLDIKGKVGPGLQLTKCYHQPNDNFTNLPPLPLQTMFNICSVAIGL